MDHKYKIGDVFSYRDSGVSPADFKKEIFILTGFYYTSTFYALKGQEINGCYFCKFISSDEQITLSQEFVENCTTKIPEEQARILKLLYF